MKNFRTYDLAMSFYRECVRIKINDGVIKNQFKRASLSIVLNLSEGVAKYSRNDRRRFYSISLGSTNEVLTLLDIMNHSNLYKQGNILKAHICNLIKNPGGV